MGVTAAAACCNRAPCGPAGVISRFSCRPATDGRSRRLRIRGDCHAHHEMADRNCDGILRGRLRSGHATIEGRPRSARAGRCQGRCRAHGACRAGGPAGPAGIARRQERRGRRAAGPQVQARPGPGHPCRCGSYARPAMPPTAPLPARRMIPAVGLLWRQSRSGHFPHRALGVLPPARARQQPPRGGLCEGRLGARRRRRRHGRRSKAADHRRRPGPAEARYRRHLWRRQIRQGQLHGRRGASAQTPGYGMGTVPGDGSHELHAAVQHARLSKLCGADHVPGNGARCQRRCQDITQQ